MAESVDKLKEELGKLVHSLKLSAFSGVREQAQNLIHKDLFSFGVFFASETKRSLFVGHLGELLPLIEGLSWPVFRPDKLRVFLKYTLLVCTEYGRRTVQSIGQY